MDLRIIVEVFVVVVIGGLGSVPGAFVAAVLVSELNAFGILVCPKISLILVFLVMARACWWCGPSACFGRPEAPQRAAPGAATPRPWRPAAGPRAARRRGPRRRARARCRSSPATTSLTVAAEILIFVLFAASLQFLMRPGGLASFGHAAYFGLGAYGAALVVEALGWPMLAGVAPRPLARRSSARVLFGWFCVRLSGVYFAMLTLAFAQIAWSVAFQWVEVTGGDNGILGVWPPRLGGDAGALLLALPRASRSRASRALRMLVFSPFGYALRAVAGLAAARRGDRHRPRGACNGPPSSSPAPSRRSPAGCSPS